MKKRNCFGDNDRHFKSKVFDMVCRCFSVLSGEVKTLEFDNFEGLAFIKAHSLPGKTETCR